MAHSCIAAMGACFLLALGAMLGSAEAQSPGAPLPLLQINHAKAAVHAHHKARARSAKTAPAHEAAHRHIAGHGVKSVHAKTRIADAGHDVPIHPATPHQTASQNDSGNIWPSPTGAALGYAAAPVTGPMDGGHPAALAPPPPGAVTTERVVDTDPNAILNGSHTVPAAMPVPVKPAPSAPQPKSAAANSSPPMKTAAVAPAMPRPAVHAMLVKPSPRSSVGSASWIAQLLAALGGALAAGAVAWFLIRPAPQRNYG